MILEITGMLVTAIAIANTSRNDVGFPFGPQRLFWSITCRIAIPARNGRTIPVTNTEVIVLRARRWKIVRTSVPVMNIKSSSPSCATAATTIGTAPESGKTHDSALGETIPSNVGPSRTPPTTSPIARGWRARTNSVPTLCAQSSSAARATRICAISTVERDTGGLPGTPVRMYEPIPYGAG